MKSFGIKYVVDPASAHGDLSQDQVSLDYLQFPAQTLSYRSGDCDDLSICYAALLESIGIETAFVTVPGHIFMAFAIDISPEAVAKTFLRPEDFIVNGGKSWVPVETTAVQEGFLEAWKLGAQQWREHNSAGASEFIPIREAWRIYEAIGVKDEDFVVAETNIEEVLSQYKREFARFVDRETFERTKILRAQAQSSNNPAKFINKIGVLYAKYGRYEKAMIEFLAAAKSGYVPAMVNLGNIFYLQDNNIMAVDYFERARESEPDNVAILVGLAKTYHEMEDLEQVQRMYDQIGVLSPETAEKLAYLSTQEVNTKAADATKQKFNTIIWDEH